MPVTYSARTVLAGVPRSPQADGGGDPPRRPGGGAGDSLGGAWCRSVGRCFFSFFLAKKGSKWVVSTDHLRGSGDRSAGGKGVWFVVRWFVVRRASGAHCWLKQFLPTGWRLCLPGTPILQTTLAARTTRRKLRWR